MGNFKCKYWLVILYVSSWNMLATAFVHMLRPPMTQRCTINMWFNFLSCVCMRRCLCLCYLHNHALIWHVPFEVVCVCVYRFNATMQPSHRVYLYVARLSSPRWCHDMPIGRLPRYNIYHSYVYIRTVCVETLVTRIQRVPAPITFKCRAVCLCLLHEMLFFFLGVSRVAPSYGWASPAVMGELWKCDSNN